MEVFKNGSNGSWQVHHAKTKGKEPDPGAAGRKNRRLQIRPSRNGRQGNACPTIPSLNYCAENWALPWLHWEPQKLIRIGKLVHDIFLFRRGCPIIWHLCPPLLPQAVTMDAFCARHSSPRHRERVPDLNSYFAVSVRQICCVRSHLYPHFSATRADSFEPHTADLPNADRFF